MEKLIGLNKNIDEQVKILKEILMKNKTLKKTLEVLEEANIDNCYVGAGAINQTVFNYYHDFDLEQGIKDFDIVYFSEDTSYEAEDKIINFLQEKLSSLNISVDIKNEARVHLWYKNKYGYDIKPYNNVEEAISSWGATVTCIGVRLKNKKLIVFAPYGLNDLFEMTIRPIKGNFNKDKYFAKTTRWKNTWPMIKIIPWPDNEI